MSALFWAVASTSVLTWLVNEFAAFHYGLDPAAANAIWSAWWDPQDPLAEFFWGAVMLACAGGLWMWIGRLGVREEVAPRGDLGALVVILIAASIVIDWAAMYPIDFVAMYVTGIEDLPSEKPEYVIESTVFHLPGDLFSAVIAAPLFEELAFRGFLLSVLLARGWPTGISIVLVAALFAGLHVQYYSWAQLSVFVFGVMMGYLRIASGGIAAPILAHAANNLFIVLMSYGS